VADIVLSSVDLDVFSGPESIDLSLDFGATGERGSRILAGNDLPATELVGQDVKLYDMYIRTTTAEMYQYVLEVGSPAWVKITDLGLEQYNAKINTSFTSGTSVITYPAKAGATTSDYLINYSMEYGGYPVAVSHALTIISDVLYIVLYAVYYTGSSWSNATGTMIVNLGIKYVG
jgi:hypothetical protein